jgi:hypothetical protein
MYSIFIDINSRDILHIYRNSQKQENKIVHSHDWNNLYSIFTNWIIDHMYSIFIDINSRDILHIYRNSQKQKNKIVHSHNWNNLYSIFTN